MIEILLIEDDPILARGICVNLELEGYKVHWASDLKSGGEANRRKPLNLILLDINLPDGNGLDLLRELRKSGSRIPILILTAKTDEDTVVEGLQSGANDYIRKPFGIRELLARIKTALREPQNSEPQIRFGDLLILIDQRRVLFEDKAIEFSRREFDILSYLIQHAETVVPRKTLLETIDNEAELFDRTIDSHVSHVRARLRQAGVKSVQISSVYGLGYRLEKK